MLQFYHNLPLLIRVYQAARISVSRNAFLNSRSEEENIFNFDVHTGLKQIKMWFRGVVYKGFDEYHFS